MVRERYIPAVQRGMRGVLYLDGLPVGDVLVQGWDASWTYGQFEPSPAFGRFAPVFGRWSLLMHEDEDEPVSDEMLQALNNAERQMDALRARVYFPSEDVWHEVAQLNIDGDLIEWKEV